MASLSSFVSLTLVVLSAVRPALSQATNDFSFYPAGAQACLNSSANASKCSGATVADLNKCLCGNGGNFITTAAACIYSSDKADFNTVYDTMSSACNTSNTPIAISSSQFLAAAANGASTTTSTKTKSPAATSTYSSGNTITNSQPATTSTPGTNPTADGSSGLSSGAQAGIIAGCVVAGLAAAGAAAWFFLRRRARNAAARHEAQPMLTGGPSPPAPEHPGAASTPPPENGPSELSSYAPVPYPAALDAADAAAFAEWKAEKWRQSSHHLDSQKVLQPGQHGSPQLSSNGDANSRVWSTTSAQTLADPVSGLPIGQQPRHTFFQPPPTELPSDAAPQGPGVYELPTAQPPPQQYSYAPPHGQHFAQHGAGFADQQHIPMQPMQPYQQYPPQSRPPHP